MLRPSGLALYETSTSRGERISLNKWTPSCSGQLTPKQMPLD